jgi:hypothetical protein
MSHPAPHIPIALEIGKTRTFATAVDHPGWSRGARESVIETLGAAVRGEIPARGPRGGLRWTPRYFVRRLCWHVLDHVWEIEDRITHPERAARAAATPDAAPAGSA